MLTNKNLSQQLLHMQEKEKEMIEKLNRLKRYKELVNNSVAITCGVIIPFLKVRNARKYSPAMLFRPI